MRGKQVGRQILSALLALCLVLGMLPVAALAVEPETPTDATAQLQQQIDQTAAAGDDGVVTLSGDILLTRPLVFPANKQIRLEGKGPNYPTISPAPSFQGDALVIINACSENNQKQVTLDRIVINGGEGHRGILVNSNANLHLGGHTKDGDMERVTILRCHSSGANNQRQGDGSFVLALS